MAGRPRLLVDTDAGLDDAQALVMALATPEVTLEAVTTVMGNTSVSNVSRNVLRLLKTTGHLEVPVYEGCAQALSNWNRPKDYSYHGDDGFGDMPDPSPPDLGVLQSSHASTAMVDLVRTNPGEITLVSLGPLTNVAVALRLWPDFASSLKQCVIMGGNIRAHGNVTQCAEFNFFCDPTAAEIVLSELRCPITMVAWEICLDNPVSWDTYERLFSAETAVCRLLRQAEAKTLSTVYGEERRFEHYQLADQLAMAAALHPELILESHPLCVTVETAGNYTKGQTVIDRRAGAKPNVTMVMRMDMQGVLALLEKALRLH